MRSSYDIMGNYIKSILSLFRKPVPQEHTLEEIKDFFKNQGGGSIDLLLNEDGIANLVLNNPDKRNAVSGKMMVELFDAVTELEKWENGKGLLIHGAGIGFCSGGDLDFIRTSKSPTIGSDMSRLLTNALERLSALPFVSLAYIHGFGALGGGSEIAMAADFRIMSPGSRIGFVHGKMGITPAWGGAARLVKVIGRGNALDLLLTARLVTSDEARDIGLAQKCGDLNCADNYLRSLCVLAPSVIRGIKASVSGNEAEVFASLFGGEENKRALAARIKHTE